MSNKTETTVFVPNMPTRWEPSLQKDIPRIDLRNAERYGEIKALSWGDISNEQFAARLGEARRTLDAEYHDGDLLVCVGDVTMAAALMAHVGAKYGAVCLLRWRRAERDYECVEVTF